MSERIDCAVIGAGVIGLAVGRALAQAGRDVLVIERNDSIGEETSSRNSEVIHAGIYYPPGSLKATLCVSGKASLYRYCEKKRIPYRRCGKLIVATGDRQLPRLAQIAARAGRNGVTDLVALDADDVREREPAVRAVAGLWSPSTGILDSHALMLALAGDFEAAGGLIATQSNVASIAVTRDGIRLEVSSAGQASELNARTVVNAAGLGALGLAASCTGVPDYAAPEGRLAKGNYFVYTRPNPFRSLVYPLPVDGGLGIHATMDLDGKLRFGPDVEWIDAIDYAVDPSRRDSFAESIREYWPELDPTALEAGYAGIRPKLADAGDGPADFRIDVAAAGQTRQLIHLLGIESPGLTSALALAEATCARLGDAAGRVS